MNYKYSHFNIV